MEGAFFGLTTNAEIRAQLGASDVEFSDDIIESLNLADELKLDLLSWFPDYVALSDDDSTETSVVVQQLSLKSYCKAFCALQSIPTVRLGFLQK